MNQLHVALEWSMAATSQFKANCESGLTALGIDFFHFVRIDEQQKRTMLCTHPLWLDYCVQQQLFHTPVISLLNDQLPSGEYTWHEFDQKDPILQHGRDYLGLKSGLSIIIRQATVSYGYHFGEIAQSHLFNSASQQYASLYRFILMFHDKAEALLQQAYAHAWMVDIPREPKSADISPNQKSILPEQQNDIHFHYDRWVLPWQGSALQFSAREMQCLACLMQGLTAKQIGKRLGISHRTVQTHWERIRMKVGTRSCHELVLAMRQSGLANLIAQSSAQASHSAAR